MGTARKEKSGESKGYQAHGMSWSLALASANFVVVWSINRGIFLKSWSMGSHFGWIRNEAGVSKRAEWF